MNIEIYYWNIFGTHSLKNILAECFPRIHITKLHKITRCVMFRILKTVVNSNQTQKDLIEPARQCFQQKKSHHNSKSTHNEENKIINFRMFLSALNEKKRLTAQSIRISIIWCPISITKNFFLILRLTKGLSMINLTLQDVFIFLVLASLVS